MIAVDDRLPRFRRHLAFECLGEPLMRLRLRLDDRIESLFQPPRLLAEHRVCRQEGEQHRVHRSRVPPHRVPPPIRSRACDRRHIRDQTSMAIRLTLVNGRESGVASPPSGALVIASSIASQVQSSPFTSSYSRRPWAHRLTKTPAAVHTRKRRWARECEQIPMASRAPYWQPMPIGCGPRGPLFDGLSP